MAHDAIIIGAGIAGAAIAHELRGRDILIVDAAGIAGAASGNPKGMIKPWLSFGESPMRRFYNAAFDHGMAMLTQHPQVVLQRGILQLPKRDGDTMSHRVPVTGLPETDIQYLSAAAASDLMQTEIRSEAIFFPRAAVINPAAWVRALIGSAPLLSQTKITAITRSKLWHCTTANNETFSAGKIYIACGHAMDLLPGIAARIRPRAGQITLAPAATLPRLPHAISFGHYFIPSQGDEHAVIGATFKHHARAEVSAAGHTKNLAALAEAARTIPALAATIPPETCTGRGAVRATTANHLPLFGAADENLYYLTGLGARGLMAAPYAARLLVQAEKK